MTAPTIQDLFKLLVEINGKLDNLKKPDDDEEKFAFSEALKGNGRALREYLSKPENMKKFRDV
jgi:hypothetical protein